MGFDQKEKERRIENPYFTYVMHNNQTTVAYWTEKVQEQKKSKNSTSTQQNRKLNMILTKNRNLQMILTKQKNPKYNPKAWY